MGDEFNFTGHGKNKKSYHVGDIEKRPFSAELSDVECETKLRKVAVYECAEQKGQGVLVLTLVVRHKDKKRLINSRPSLIQYDSRAADNIAKMKKPRDASVLIEIHSTQSRALLKLKSLFDQVPVTVEVHPTINTSRYVICCWELINLVDEIKVEISLASVTGVKCLTRLVDDEWKDLVIS